MDDWTDRKRNPSCVRTLLRNVVLKFTVPPLASQDVIIPVKKETDLQNMSIHNQCQDKLHLTEINDFVKVLLSDDDSYSPPFRGCFDYVSVAIINTLWGTCRLSLLITSLVVNTCLTLIRKLLCVTS